MVMKIKYVGEFDEADIPALQLVVKQGETIEVSDEDGLEMIKQAVWESAGAPAGKPVGKAK